LNRIKQIGALRIPPQMRGKGGEQRSFCVKNFEKKKEDKGRGGDQR